MAFAPDQALKLLKTAHDNGRLAHAFLLCGPEMPVLQRLAVDAASLINGWEAPDSMDGLRKLGAVVLEPESKIRRIKIDPVREVIRHLQFSTSDGGKKIVILSEADRLTVEATNAFLKTLEEPPPDTLILLLTRSPEQLLDTVRSRCVKLTLFRPQVDGIPLSPQQKTLLDALAAYFTGGAPSPTRAMGLLSDFQQLMAGIREEIEEDHKESFKEETEHYGRSTDGVWLRERKEYYEDLTEGACAEHRNALVGTLYSWLGELLRRRHHLPVLDLPGYAAVTERVAETLSDAEIHRRLAAVDEIRRNLSTTVREVLALEAGFLHAFG